MWVVNDTKTTAHIDRNAPKTAAFRPKCGNWGETNFWFSPPGFIPAGRPLGPKIQRSKGMRKEVPEKSFWMVGLWVCREVLGSTFSWFLPLRATYLQRQDLMQSFLTGAQPIFETDCRCLMCLTRGRRCRVSENCGAKTKLVPSRTAALKS